jgi:hypothetical protein
MDVSGDDTALPERQDWMQSRQGATSKQEDTMKAVSKYLAPSLAAAAIGGAVVLAPLASAATHVAPAPTPATSSAPTDTDPLVPYGTDPHSPYVFGYHTSDHDESDTTNGQLDVPF